MKKILFATNVFTFFVLFIILFHGHYPQRFIRRLNGSENKCKSRQSISYLNNENYKELTDIYAVYSEQKNIVMLGSSLTYRINWDELTGRCDIANRGIGSDITEGYINRLNSVLNVHPKICFIEGGINDLGFEIANDTIINNLNALIDTLSKNNVIPVLHTVTYVSKKYKDAKRFNGQIKELNKMIVQLSLSKNIQLIDLNALITKDDFLPDENTLDDGLHYTGKTYIVWKKEIVNILSNERI